MTGRLFLDVREKRSLASRARSSGTRGTTTAGGAAGLGTHNEFTADRARSRHRAGCALECSNRPTKGERGRKYRNPTPPGKRQAIRGQHSAQGDRI